VDLISAAWRGDIASVTKLLENDTHIDARDSVTGMTALHNAVYQRHNELVLLLLDCGADINSRNNDGDTPVMCAAMNSNSDIGIMKLLLEHDPNVDLTGKYGRTPLMLAAYNGHEEIAQMLLSYGADIDATCADGYTALMNAAMSNASNIDTLELLLNYGANFRMNAKDGNNALVWAMQNGNLDKINLLLDRGAKVEDRKYDDVEEANILASDEASNAVEMKTPRRSTIHGESKTWESWKAVFLEACEETDNELEFNKAAALCSSLADDRVKLEQVQKALRRTVKHGNGRCNLIAFVFTMKLLQPFSDVWYWKAAFLEIAEVMEEEELDLDTTAALCVDLIGDRVPFDTVKAGLKAKDKDGNQSLSLTEFLLAMKQLSRDQSYWKATFEQVCQVVEKEELDLETTEILCSFLFDDRISLKAIRTMLTTDREEEKESFDVMEFLLKMDQLKKGIAYWKAAFLEICEVMEVGELDLDTTATLCSDLVGDCIPFDSIKATLITKDKDGNEKFGLVEFIFTMRHLS